MRGRSRPGRRPEFDRLDAPRERVWCRLEREDASRTGQEEASSTWSFIHVGLDRQQQLGDALDLVNGKRARHIDEALGVGGGCSPHVRIVEGARCSVRAAPCDDPHEGALAGLTRALHEHYARLGQGNTHSISRPSRPDSIEGRSVWLHGRYPYRPGSTTICRLVG